jgi:hypothetical protein
MMALIGAPFRNSRRVRALLVLSLTIGLTGASGPSAANEIFAVRDIAVDKRAGTASAARELALAESRQTAYRTVLQRITLPEDFDRHPMLDDADIAGLVQSFDIANEKTSQTRYLADVTVRFARQSVRELLQAFSIPFSETAARPLLIIPVYQAAGLKLLWEDGNPWLAPWVAQEGKSGLRPVIAPLGDLEDITSINLDRVTVGDAETITAAKQRYQTAGVLVALADLKRDLLNSKNILRVTLTEYGTDAENTEVMTFEDPMVDDVGPFLARTVDEIMMRRETEWKRRTLLDFDHEDKLVAVVPLDGIQTWLTVQQRLYSLAEVRKIEVTALSAHAAHLTVSYLGQAAQLTVALAERGLTLQEHEGYWTLKLADQAAASN